jgi:ribosomal protein L2
MYPKFSAQENEHVKLEFFIDQGEHCFLSEDGDIHGKYVSDNQLVTISHMELQYSDDELEIGSTFQIENIPFGSTIMIDGETVGIMDEEGGTLDANFTDQGSYDVVISKRPQFYDFSITVTVK